jgi:DNA-binding response OmpR family regulator
MMFMMTGVDLLKKLHAAHLAVPVIMATGTLPADEFARSQWLQPPAVLTKPYTVDELLVKVRQILQVADSPLQQDPPPPTGQNQLGPGSWFLH